MTEKNMCWGVVRKSPTGLTNTTVKALTVPMQDKVVVTG